MKHTLNKLARAALLSAGVLALGMATNAHATTITPDWSLAPAARAYFPNSANPRGIAFNPVTGNVLVSNAAAPFVSVVNEATGDFVGTGTGSGPGTGILVSTGIAGGSPAFSKIRVVDFGGNSYGIIGANITSDARAATNNLRIYYWYAAPGASPAAEDTLGAPRVIYSNNAIDGATNAGGVPSLASPVGPKLPEIGATLTYRVGDTFAVAQGTGANEGTVQIYMSVSDGALHNRVFKLTFPNANSSTASNVVTNVEEITLTGLPAQYGYGTAYRGLWVDGWDGPIYHVSNTVAAKFTNAGVFESLLGGVTSSNIATSVASSNIAMGTVGGTTYIASIAEGGDNQAGVINSGTRMALSAIDPTDALDFTFLGHGASPATMASNGNLTGDFAFNPTTGKVYALITSNIVGRYSIPATPTNVAVTWDGGASTTNWFDAANWSNDQVPGTNTDVTIAGAAVTIAQTGTSEAYARTITLGSGGTLTIPATNLMRTALTISGDGNPATDDLVVQNGGAVEFYSGVATGLAANIVYWADPTSTARFQSGGTLRVNSARSIANAFPADLPSGYQQTMFGRTTFDSGSTLDFTATSTAAQVAPILGRTIGTLRLSGAFARTITVTSAVPTLSASTAFPTVIQNGITIADTGTKTFNPTTTGPFELNGPITGTFAGTVNATPWVIGGNVSIPAMTISGDLVIKPGFTLTQTGNTTYGAANTGRIIDVQGTLLRTAGNSTVNSIVAVRNGGAINGYTLASQWVWGATGGLGVVDTVDGLDATPSAADFPGATITPPNFFTGLTTPLARSYAFMGDVADQPAGAFFNGASIANITVKTSGSVVLPGNLTVSGRLRMWEGVVKTGANKLTLGTGIAAVGTFDQPLGALAQVNASVQGNFERWVAATAATNLEFPLSDGANYRKLLVTYAALSTAGSLTASFVGSDPGGTIDAQLHNGSAAGLRVRSVNNTGYWTLTSGNGLAGGGTNVTYTVDVGGGFGANARAGNASVISRPAAGAWVIGAAAITNPVSAVINGIQTSSNPTSRPVPQRLIRAGYPAFTAGGTVEIGVGTTTPNLLPPTDAGFTPVATINENNVANFVVGTLAAGTDPDAFTGQTISLSLAPGAADNAFFNINGSNLRVTAANTFDFETKNSYTVRIRSTDGGYPYLFTDTDFTININDVNEPATGINLSNNTIPEGGSPFVGTLTATGDPDAGLQTHTFSVVGGADSASFIIFNGNELWFNIGLDFETKSSYAVQLRATDQGGASSANIPFTITITDVPEPPSLVTLTSTSVLEGTRFVGILNGNDPDNDPEPKTTFTIVSGAGSNDNNAFEILNGNELSFKASNPAPLFENQATYRVRIRATDNYPPFGFIERSFTITIINVNQAPTSLGITKTTINEGQTIVGALFATDPDPATAFSYTLASGAGSDDNSLFAITAGNLVLLAPADFETKQSYNVRVRVTDNGSPALFLEQPFVITVVDINEPPTDITLTNNTLAEGVGGREVGTLAAVGDPEVSQTHTFSLVPGTGSTDNAKFTITGNSLRLAQGLEAGDYFIRIRALDSGVPPANLDRQFTITLTDVPDADGDGIPDVDEVGDANNDGILDKLQPNVAQVASSASTPLVLVSSAGVLGSIVTSVPGGTLPDLTTFPHGVVSFTVTVSSPGDSVTMTITFPETTGVNQAVKENTGVYTPIAGATVTTTSISYTLTDGGALDQDGLANGVIVDPVGPAVFTQFTDWEQLEE